MKFSELNLGSQLLEAISYMGFEETTPVQEQVIPVVLKNNDLIAVAQTGTGKTAAFVLPILNKLAGKKDHSIDTLIIVPTRELAIQIDQQIQGFSYFIPAQSIAVYGGGSGTDWDSEVHAFKHGADIIIATPGRLLSHIRMGTVSFKKLRHLVLDEADRMLDMGFIDDIRTIVSKLPEERQTLLFSATMPPAIRGLAKKILTDPIEVSLAVSTPAEGIDQKMYLVSENQKDIVLKHILSEKTDYSSIIIFSSTKRKISEIVRTLSKAGFQAKGISSDFEQDKREEILREFRARKIRILVATDVMSRGIDIKDINLIVNYDVPRNAEDYVHRIGRTARVRAVGEAVMLATPREAGAVKKIERLIKMPIPQMLLPENVRKETSELHRRSEPAGKAKTTGIKDRRTQRSRDSRTQRPKDSQDHKSQDSRPHRPKNTKNSRPKDSKTKTQSPRPRDPSPPGPAQ
ncbi:MAG TPA: DEAD/DEAH box helicase [Bacteroidales bacterium]|nr:DEAD/DEAH box helicase [Bacteroidales bacterium]